MNDRDAEIVMEAEGAADSEALAVMERAAELAIPDASEFHGYVGASLLVLKDTEAAGFAAILPDDDHDILPTGEVYVTQVRYRRLLNATLGPGQWALVPRGGWTRQGSTLCREYALVVRGSFVAEAVGEAEYQESNERMTWATAAEACKSNALTRCCKDLGIASECWDKRWTAAWIQKYAVKVWVDGKNKPLWRRKDAEPFWKERGPVDATPATQQQTKTEPARRAEPPKQNGHAQDDAASDLAASAFLEETLGEYAEAKTPDDWNRISNALKARRAILSDEQYGKLVAARTSAKKRIAALTAEPAA